MSGLHAFPNAGTISLLVVLGGFGAVLFLGLLFNLAEFLLPSGMEDDQMSSGNVLVTSTGLAWILVMLQMLPDSPFSSGLAGDGDRRLVQLLTYVLDSGLNVLALDVPDLWGWNVSGLTAESRVSRTFTVVLRATIAWGLFRWATASRHGLIGPQSAAR